jgi:hypothetical protein
MPPALFALLLALAEPPAPAADPAPPPAAEADAELADRIPAGAPKDDYGFVAWCDGVLSGHMDLAERVKDVLPLDPVQQKIGKAYIAAYEKALAGAPDASTEAGRKRADAARNIGWRNWDRARKADKQLAADTYLAWQLPGHCERAAINLSGDKDLFRMSPTTEEVEAMGVQAPVANSQAAQTQAADELPAGAGAGAPPAVLADELKIKTIPDPATPTQTPAERKAEEDKARQQRLEEETLHPDPHAPQ